MNKQQAIWFIIVAYNPQNSSIVRIIELLPEWSVVVVDNTQSRASISSLDRELATRKNIVYIPNGKNLGYGGGVNIGIRTALWRGAQWVVVLNQDLQLTKPTVAALVSQLEQCAPSVVGPFGGSLDRKRWTTQLPAAKNIDYVSGACMAIHRDVIEKIGFFYEPYFMYYEDADYSVRAARHGFPLQQMVTPGVKHSDTQALGRGSALHEYYLARNHLLFVDRNAPMRVKLYELLRFPKTVYEHIREGNTGAVKGITDYLLRRFGRGDAL